MITALTLLFAVSTIALLLPHAGYPPLVFLLSRLKKRRLAGNAQPRLTLVISAFNEIDVIREKIENALSLEYPRELLEVMVISDGSNDGTDKVVSEYVDRNVRLCRQDPQRGKSAGLTRFCPEAAGDILVFTDANSIFQPQAIKKLVRHFDDPTVGYTVGSQLYDAADHGASADSENLYWSIELKLKEWESRLSSVVGADGAIYALRKELFEPLAAEDINDFLIPLRVVAKGYRGVFDPQAICYEKAAPDFKGEFRRKYRIVNRSIRAVCKVPQAFNPFRVGWFSLQLILHKVLRWLGPLFMVLMLFSSGYLAANELTGNSQGYLFTAFLCLQLAGYAAAALYALPPLRKFKLVYIAYYFLLINCAAALGIGLLVRGHTIGVWKPQR